MVSPGRICAAGFTNCRSNGAGCELKKPPIWGKHLDGHTGPEHQGGKEPAPHPAKEACKMKQAIILGLVTLLAGCGGGGDRSRSSGGFAGAMPFAAGPISQACMVSGRSARSSTLCGCIQAAADQTLSGSQQRRAVAFYSDPHSAQEIRQSDRASDRSFWQAYRAYGDRAERLCR